MKFTVSDATTLNLLISLAEDYSSPSVLKWLDKIDCGNPQDVPKDIQETLVDLVRLYGSIHANGGITIG